MRVDPVWLAPQLARLALHVPPRPQQKRTIAAGLDAVGLGPFVVSPTHSCAATQSLGMGSIDTGSGTQLGGLKLHLVAKLASL